MKWLSKKGIRGIAYFVIMVLVLTSVLTGDVMRAKADDDPMIYTCNLTVSPYDGEHGCVKYIDPDGDEQTVSASGDTVDAMAVLYEAYQGWHVAQIVYNNNAVDNPGSDPIDFFTEGDKSFSITFAENAGESNEGDEGNEGSDPQNPQIYECALTVSAYDGEHGYIAYTLDGDHWESVEPDTGCSSVRATAVVFGTHQNSGWYVSQIIYNNTTINNPDFGFLDFTTEGDKSITGITFAEGGGSNPGGGDPVIQIQASSYTDTNGKIQYSTDGSTWTDIPAEGLGPTTASFVRAVPNTGYSVRYKIDSEYYTDTLTHGLGDNPSMHWIQDVEFTSNYKSLTVNPYTNTGGKIQYSTNGTTWTDVPAAGGTVQANYVKAVAGNGYTLDSYTLNSNTIYSDSSQTLAEDNNTLSSVSFIQNSSTAGKYLLSVDYLTSVSSTVTVKFLNSTGEDIGTASVDSAAAIPDGTAKIRIALSDKRFLKTIQIFRVAALAEPGAQGSTEIARPAVEEGLWQNGTVDFTASNAYSYRIAIQISDTKNVGWSYREADRGTDLFVENCKLYLLDQNGNRRAYIDESDDNKATTDYASYNLTIGQTYKFELVPDYGYQIVGLNINGYTLAPTNDTGVFSFTMSNTNFHFQGVVDSAEDIVSAPAAYSGATISGGSNAASNGNVRMTISDKATDNSAAAIAGEGATAVATLDIDLDKVVSKGDGTYWSDGITEFTNNVTVSVPVPANGLSAGQTYSVVREHNGLKTELNATYNSATGMLTFGSNQFSDYTIVKVPGTPATDSASAAKEETKQESSESSSGNDDNDDSSNGSTAKAVASTLGSIVDKTATGGLASKTVIKDWNDLNNVLLKDNANNAAVRNNKKVLSDRQKAKGELVQVVLNKKDATIPDSTFDSLYKSDKSGLHVFVANGTALTFINNRQLRNQKALDLTCNVTSANGSKIISFKTYAKLKAKTMLHTTVPAGVKTVTVYKYDAKGNRKYFGKLKPTAEGRVCFGVTELTKYELVYNY